MERRTGLKRGGPLKRAPLKQRSTTRSANGKAAAAAAKRERLDNRLDEDAAFRAAVLERDGHRCRCCGRPADEAHHAAEKSTHPQYRGNPAVGVALCWSCHRWIHDGAAGRNAEAKRRGLLVPAWVQDLRDVVAWIEPTGPCGCRG